MAAGAAAQAPPQQHPGGQRANAQRLGQRGALALVDRGDPPSSACGRLATLPAFRRPCPRPRPNPRRRPSGGAPAGAPGDRAGSACFFWEATYLSFSQISTGLAMKIEE